MKNIYEIEKRVLGETTEKRIGIVIKKAFGSTIIDERGKKYIDFTSGWNVTNIGWKRREIEEAVGRQMKKYSFAPMWLSQELSVVFAEKLQRFLPAKLNTFFKATGGTEANEIAIKLARVYTGKKKIISFSGEYHGQTFGSMSLGNSRAYTKPFEPVVPGFIKIHPPYSYRCDYGKNLSVEKCGENCLERIRRNIKTDKNIAAFFSEPILTCPGIIIPPKNFFKELKKICDKNKILIIMDEVGTGFGRTGKMFGFENYGFTPDIVTFAKAVTGGFGPMGGVATSRKIADSVFGKGGTSTYGWHPLSLVAAIKSLEIIEKERLTVRATEMGEYILFRLKKELYGVEIVGEIRGIGLEMGIEFVTNQKTKKPNHEAVQKIKKACLKDGLHIMETRRTSTLLIMPPLMITKKETDRGLDILIKNIKSL